jgi:hypothetical protein
MATKRTVAAMATVTALLAGGIVGASIAVAQRSRPVQFAFVHLFLEYNSTDEDAGVQAFFDGEAWKQVSITDPSGEEIVHFSASGDMQQLGLTELFFESAEPSPEEVLSKFDEGRYRFDGTTVDGKAIRGTAQLSHDLPPAATLRPEDGAVVDPHDTVVSWSHPDPGSLQGYEVIVEREDEERKMSVELGPDATSMRVPAEFMAPGAEYKAEILALGSNGNKTITERSFETSG